jgi:hypothetical protein
VTSNHQTTNLDFPNFFHEFFSVLAVEKENKFFQLLKQFFSQFWANDRFVFFSTAQTENFEGKNWENKIGCLVV